MYVISLCSSSTLPAVLTRAQDLSRCVVKITGDCIITSDIIDIYIVCDGSVTLQNQVIRANIFAKGDVCLQGNVSESVIHSAEVIKIGAAVDAQETKFSAAQVQLSEGAKLQQCNISSQPKAMVNGLAMRFNHSAFFGFANRNQTPSPIGSSSDMSIGSEQSDDQEGGPQFSDSSEYSLCEMEPSLGALLSSYIDTSSLSEGELSPETVTEDDEPDSRLSRRSDSRRSGYAWT